MMALDYKATCKIKYISQSDTLSEVEEGTEEVERGREARQRDNPREGEWWKSLLSVSDFIFGGSADSDCR